MTLDEAVDKATDRETSVIVNHTTYRDTDSATNLAISSTTERSIRQEMGSTSTGLSKDINWQTYSAINKVILNDLG